MSTYSVAVLGNVEKCRTEAEVSRGDRLVAVVYESADGWHTEIVDGNLVVPQSSFDAALNSARQTLSQYVNRLGSNPPRGMTVGALSLWLMVKSDGNAMGIAPRD